MKISQNIVERVVNVLVLVCLVFVLGLLAYRYVPSSTTTQSNEVAQFGKGSKIDLPGVNWAQNRVTLVLALAVGCHYCQESAGFYRDLIASNTHGAFRPLAVLPQEVEQSKKYLQTEGIVTDVRQVDFGKLGVKGTPTLILVDSSGYVESEWVGKLSVVDEKQVYKSLGVQPPMHQEVRDTSQGIQSVQLDGTIRDSDVIAGSHLLALLNARVPAPVLDTRSRPQYAASHIAGSLNIPEDELEMRAIHEVPLDSPVVIYCEFTATCQAAASARRGKSSSLLVRNRGDACCRIYQNESSQWRFGRTQDDRRTGRWGCRFGQSIRFRQTVSLFRKRERAVRTCQRL